MSTREQGQRAREAMRKFLKVKENIERRMQGAPVTLT
jgi:hypothetical protein